MTQLPDLLEAAVATGDYGVLMDYLQEHSDVRGDQLRWWLPRRAVLHTTMQQHQPPRPYRLWSEDGVPAPWRLLFAVNIISALFNYPPQPFSRVTYYDSVVDNLVARNLRTTLQRLLHAEELRCFGLPVAHDYYTLLSDLHGRVSVDGDRWVAVISAAYSWCGYPPRMWQGQRPVLGFPTSLLLRAVGGVERATFIDSSVADDIKHGLYTVMCVHTPVWAASWSSVWGARTSSGWVPDEFRVSYYDDEA